MSFYDDASWLLIPSGIEEDIVFAQKPISGLGDLQFTRASDATYTDASGVVRRSPYNLLQMSEMFADSYWLKSGSTITANATPAPNNTLTADKLVEDSLLSEHGLTRIGAITTSGVYTFSAFVKAAERTRVALGNSSTGQYVIFDLSLGTVVRGSQGTVTNAAISSIDANGFYRISCNITVSSASSVRVNLVSTGTTINYLGDGTSGIFIWGAQLVEGTSALDYFPTTNRQDVPRIDFRNADGTLSSCGRLLLEPQRTNSIRNSSMVGAVAGTPGTLPTNWAVNLAGLTQTIVGIGVESGLPYIDLRFNGTASGSQLDYRYDGTTQIAATSGQVWTHSFYYKIIAQPQPPLTYAHQILERSAAGGILADTSTIFTSSTSLSQFQVTRTLNNASTAFVQPQIRHGLTVGATYDFTIRIAAPQMELGAYATTWVPTTTTAVTRIADAASKTGVASLIGQTEGTLFVEFDNSTTAQGTTRRVFVLSDGTSNNRIGVSINTVNSMDCFVTVGAVSQASIIFGTTSIQRYKIALAYAQNDVVFYVNGVQIGIDTSATIPSLSGLYLGRETGVNDLPLGSGYNQAALFTTRLTNAQLAQLTTL